MKRYFFLYLTILCQIVYAKPSVNDCIGVVSTNANEEWSKTYVLNIRSNNTYMCDENNQSCMPLLIKDLPKKPYDDNANLASIMSNSIEFLNENGFLFDKYGLALEYAHSISIPIFTAKYHLNHSLKFENNILTISFPKSEQYEIGAYPRGMLRPIDYMFIQDKIAKVVIQKHEGRVEKATFTTNKNEKFQYRLTYQKDRLIKSEILFQKTPQSAWWVDTVQDYHYIPCSVK